MKSAVENIVVATGEISPSFIGSPMLNNKSISSWVRQSRYRAKQQTIYSDLKVGDIATITEHSNKCAYCGGTVETIDSPFPLKDGCPNVPANVVLCCKPCKTIKNNNDVVWMFLNGHISRDAYIVLIDELCKRRGGDMVKEYISKITGMGA